MRSGHLRKTDALTAERRQACPARMRPTISGSAQDATSPPAWPPEGFAMTRNRLGEETSPYLLQHADNPVHWYAWGEEALAEAKRQDKPILLSVGYAACHWC